MSLRAYDESHRRAYSSTTASRKQTDSSAIHIWYSNGVALDLRQNPNKAARTLSMHESQRTIGGSGRPTLCGHTLQFPPDKPPDTRRNERAGVNLAVNVKLGGALHSSWAREYLVPRIRGKGTSHTGQNTARREILTMYLNGEHKV